jgi:hypothetical protein
MAFRTTIPHLFSIALAMTLFSCSNQKKDYEEIQKLQTVFEQRMKKSFDYDTRIQDCDSIITAFQKFIASHNSSEWTTMAQNNIASWQAKKATIENDSIELTNRVFEECKEKACWEASKKHLASHIENISLADKRVKVIGTQLVVLANYNVNMIGNIWGKDTFNFNVHVLGRGNVVTNNVAIDSSARVVEIASERMDLAQTVQKIWGMYKWLKML